MNEEVMRVLKMVEEGKLSSEKASQLIEALNNGEKEDNNVTLCNVSDENYGNKMLKIQVDSHDGDEVKVNLPVNFISGVLKACGKFPMNIECMEGIDSEMLIQSITAALDNKLMGEIVKVNSHDGDVVRIFIE